MTNNRHDESLFDEHQKTDQVEHLAVLRQPEEGNIIGGRYQIQQELAPHRYIVKHLGVHQDFLMRMAPTLAPGSRAETRLQQVAQSAGLIGHESLGFITDFGFAEEFGAYIVSQYVEGTTLASLFEEGEQLSLEGVLEFALQVGGALASIHEVGVAHGLFAPVDLIQTPHGRWKLLGAGIVASPQYEDGFKPPEVERYRDITAKSDQYTFASYLYQLLVGTPPEGDEPFEPSTLRADVPMDVDTSIMKARSGDPGDRFESMDALLDALHQAFAEWHEPSMSPFDAREASRLLSLHPDVEKENEFVRSETKKSVVVSIESLADAPSKLDVQFASAARLRREYRRNIVARGLFVPMLHPLSPSDEKIRVRISYSPTGDDVEIEGNVASMHPGAEDHPTGVGIAFDSEAHESVMRFVRELEIGLGLKPDDLLETAGELSPDTEISSGEAFLYSRLAGAPLTVAAARSAVSGLPFDFDEAIQSLMSSRLVKRSPVAESAKSVRVPRRVDVRPASEVPEPLDPPEPTGLAAESSIALEKIQFSQEDAERILEIVDYFESQQNYMSAIETLKRALEHAPKEARFHHRAARVRAEFFGDYSGAMRSARRAVKLEPENAEYRTTLPYLESLQEAELLQPVIDLELPGFRVRMIRHDPELNRAWIEAVKSDGQPSRKLIAIDTRRRRTIAVTSAENPATMRIVPANHPRLSAFDERVPTAFKTLRERRKKLLESARRARDYGPYYRVGPEPVAWCENSTFLVFDRDPRGGTSGLFLTHEGRNSEPFRIDPDARKSVCPLFSHDEEKIAWVRVDPDPAVCTATPWDHPHELFALLGEATLTWSDDSKHLFVVEHKNGAAHRVHATTGKAEAIATGVSDISKVAFDSNRTFAAALIPGDPGLIIGIDFIDRSVVGPVELEGSVGRELIVRPDGRAVVSTSDGFWLVNLRKRTARLVAGPSAAPLALERNRWTEDEPLYMLLDTEGAAQFIEIDADKFGS